MHFAKKFHSINLSKSNSFRTRMRWGTPRPPAARLARSVTTIGGPPSRPPVTASASPGAMGRPARRRGARWVLNTMAGEGKVAVRGEARGGLIRIFISPLPICDTQVHASDCHNEEISTLRKHTPQFHLEVRPRKNAASVGHSGQRQRKQKKNSSGVQDQCPNKSPPLRTPQKGAV